MLWILLFLTIMDIAFIQANAKMSLILNRTDTNLASPRRTVQLGMNNDPSRTIWWLPGNQKLISFRRSRRSQKNEHPMIQTHLWPNGLINYEIDPTIESSKHIKILAAIQQWTKNTCLRFLPRSNGKDYLFFQDGEGHSRLDRKKFVKINYKNIYRNDAREYKIKGLDEDYLGALSTPYDHGSVMHYNVIASTPKDKAAFTIVTLDPNYMQTIGPTKRLSFLDAKRVNKAYCSDVCPHKLPCQNGGYTDPSASGSKCSSCKCPRGLGGPLCTDVQQSGNCSMELQAESFWQTISKEKENKPCNWLIKAPLGHTIRLELSLSGFECVTNGKCRNHVEVKYRGNLESTGAWFCCYPPKRPIISSSNSIIVLYRPRGNFTPRFEARYRIERFQGGNRSLSALTALEMETTSSSDTTKIVMDNGFMGTSSVEQAAENVSLTQWHSWSKCSAQCGGCGKMRRSRACLSNDVDCSKNRYEEALCNLNACTYPTPDGDTKYTCCVGFELRGRYCEPLSKTL